jgi:phenylalanyl-tRNA synthetase beta chain
MSTDASYRFERGVDVELAPRALERVAKLIMLVAGGTIDGAPADLAHEPAPARRVALRSERVSRVLGDPIAPETMAGLLGAIGFEVERTGDGLLATVPSWRSDVAAEVDLIEEVARLRGYDSFPVEIRPFRAGSVGDDPRWLTTKRVTESLVGAGLFEVRPMPFVAGGEGHVRVLNPLAENEAYLRRSVLETLARRAEYNLSRMHGDIRIFEIGSVFEPRAAQLPHEELKVGALVMGRREPRHFTDLKSPEFDAWINYCEWDAKALAANIGRTAYPGADIRLEPASTNSDGALWSISVDGRRLGEVRRIALDAPVWALPAFGVELSLGQLESAPIAPHGESVYRPFDYHAVVAARYQPVPTTPSAEVDLALLVPESVHAEEVERVIHRVSGRLLEALQLFDRYVGQGVEPGYRSLAWRLTFRHAERTLRDKEIDARRSDILRALADELNVRHRSA